MQGVFNPNITIFVPDSAEGLHFSAFHNYSALDLSPDPSPPHLLPPGVTGIDSDSKAAFPLSLVHCPHYVQSRVALVG